MLIRRNKRFSGYEPLQGVSYNSAILGTIKPLDTIDEKIEEVPVVNSVSKKIRDRIKSYTRPIKGMLTRKSKQKNHDSKKN